jgi:cytoskeletal protein RodZ
LTHDRDDVQDIPESLLQFLSKHRESSRRSGTRHRVGRHRRKVAVLLLGIVAAALVTVGLVIREDSTHRRSGPHAPSVGTDSRKSGSAPTPSHAATESTPQEKKAAPSPSQPIHVVLTAARSDSWVQIRRNDSTGRVLYDGVVSEGRSIRFVGPRFWARFGALGNFDLTVDGRPVHPSFSGTVDAVITAATIRPVTSG